MTKRVKISKTSAPVESAICVAMRRIIGMKQAVDRMESKLASRYVPLVPSCLPGKPQNRMVMVGTK